MIPVERQRKILSIVAERRVISIIALAELLGVSHMTIRRDIHKLESKGSIVSVSGGVQLIEHLSSEPKHNYKSLLYKIQKEAIGRAAAQMVHPNAVIFLDSGSTTLEIARCLLERDDICVVTNDFAISHILTTHGKCKLIHVGGEVNKENLSCVGELTAQFISNLFFEIAFVSSSSWGLNGLTTPNADKFYVKKNLVKSSKTRILVTDSSKYGKIGTFLIFPLTTFDTIITDMNLNHQIASKITQMGVNLKLV